MGILPDGRICDLDGRLDSGCLFEVVLFFLGDWYDMNKEAVHREEKW